MNIKPKSTAVLVVFSILAAVYSALFFHLYPISPGIGDDWLYLGLFQPIEPSIDRWNPARIFPEFFMPLSGYCAAYIIRPLLGIDYFQALTLTCSGIAVAAWLTLNVFAYRFFHAVGKDSTLALCGLLLLNIGFFLANHTVKLPLILNTYIAPTILFFYDLPNILNAVLVIVLCQAILTSGSGDASFFNTSVSLSNAQKHTTALAVGLIIAYFAQFSMTISSAISAIPAGSLLLFRLIRYAKSSDGNLPRTVMQKCTFLDLFCFILAIFWFIAAFYDLHGARYAWSQDLVQNILWVEILTKYYYSLTYYIPKILWITFFTVSIINVLILSRCKKNNSGNDTMYTFLCVMVVSYLLMLILNMLIFYKTNIGLDSRFLFGITLYFYIIFIVNIIFINKYTNFGVLILLPLVLYISSKVALSAPWLYRPIIESEYRIGVMKSCLKDIINADKSGKQQVDITHIYASKSGYSLEKWPHAREWYHQALSDTLFKHGVTNQKMTIYIRDAVK